MAETAQAGVAAGLPIPKFAIGQTVFVSELASGVAQHPCPDCLGSRVWSVTTPAGATMEVACGRCADRYVRDFASLDYRIHDHSVFARTVGSIEAKSCDYDNAPSVRYMCRETGVGSGRIYHESELFETHEAADRDGDIRAKLANSKESSTPAAIAVKRLSNLSMRDATLKKSRDDVWQAWWAYRRLKEDITNWAQETTLDDDAREAMVELLNWESDHRENPEPELCKALRAADHTLSVHGKIDAETDLHGTIRAALSLAEGRP